VAGSPSNLIAIVDRAAASRLRLLSQFDELFYSKSGRIDKTLQETRPDCFARVDGYGQDKRVTIFLENTMAAGNTILAKASPFECPLDLLA
jgi:hypothetical protein